jgi:hypothetical protein
MKHPHSPFLTQASARASAPNTSPTLQQPHRRRLRAELLLLGKPAQKAAAQLRRAGA